jgi:hypothetical protein
MKTGGTWKLVVLPALCVGLLTFLFVFHFFTHQTNFSWNRCFLRCLHTYYTALSAFPWALHDGAPAVFVFFFLALLLVCNGWKWCFFISLLMCVRVCLKSCLLQSKKREKNCRLARWKTGSWFSSFNFRTVISGRKNVLLNRQPFAVWDAVFLLHDEYPRRILLCSIFTVSVWGEEGLFCPLLLFLYRFPRFGLLYFFLTLFLLLDIVRESTSPSLAFVEATLQRVQRKRHDSSVLKTHTRIFTSC